LILDLNVGDSYGYPTFEKARAALPRLPIIVLSGTDDDELALRAVAGGAQDYVRKSSLPDCPLDRIARYAIERHCAEVRSRTADARYRSLFDNLPTAAFTCDTQGVITYFNRRAPELWGHAPRLNDPAFRFCGAQKLFAADGTHLPHDQSWVARAMRERRRFHDCEYSIETPGGGLRHLLINATPDLNDQGELIGCIAILVDVTEQRKLEQQLRENERFARSTVDSLAAHIAIIDATGTILAVNDAWRNFATANGGFGSDYGVGMSYLDVCDRASAAGDSIAAETAAGIRSVLRRKRDAFELEYPCHSPQEERWFMMRTTVFEGEGPTRAVVSHENVTARMVAERLAREQSGLREAITGMEQVLGVVGHELRTPLAVLRAIAEFLTMDGANETPEAERFLHDIMHEVDRMSDTVNNILEAARLSSGKTRWNWSTFDLAEVVRDAVGSIQMIVNESCVALVVGPVEGPTHMAGDAEALRRLMINLLSNAKKHTSSGRIEVAIRSYRDAQDASWADLSVRDTGCGIPPEIVARLGEAFALNSGVVGANHVSGTGLGLSICKAVAAAHGGNLLIESIPGEGTTVHARFRLDLVTACTGETVSASALEGQLT
jgi:PAS domain S-box-containing protein